MIVGAMLLCAAPVAMHWSPTKEVRLSLDTAQARLGRPLTPMSVGGSTAECIGARIMVRRRQARTITARITADIIPIRRAIEIVAHLERAKPPGPQARNESPMAYSSTTNEWATGLLPHVTIRNTSRPVLCLRVSE
jgi:hypothetical protein